MQVCFTKNIGGWDIALYQRGPKDFKVVYGKQVKDHLSYAQAARELGSCIMHALACEGNLDNSDA